MRVSKCRESEGDAHTKKKTKIPQNRALRIYNDTQPPLVSAPVKTQYPHPPSVDWAEKLRRKAREKETTNK